MGSHFDEDFEQLLKDYGQQIKMLFSDVADLQQNSEQNVQKQNDLIKLIAKSCDKTQNQMSEIQMQLQQKIENLIEANNVMMNETLQRLKQENMINQEQKVQEQQQQFSEMQKIEEKITNFSNLMNYFTQIQMEQELKQSNLMLIEKNIQQYTDLKLQEFEQFRFEIIKEQTKIYFNELQEQNQEQKYKQLYERINDEQFKRWNEQFQIQKDSSQKQIEDVIQQVQIDDRINEYDIQNKQFISQITFEQMNILQDQFKQFHDSFDQLNQKICRQEEWNSQKFEQFNQFQEVHQKTVQDLSNDCQNFINLQNQNINISSQVQVEFGKLTEKIQVQQQEFYLSMNEQFNCQLKNKLVDFENSLEIQNKQAEILLSKTIQEVMNSNKLSFDQFRQETEKKILKLLQEKQELENSCKKNENNGKNLTKSESKSKLHKKDSKQQIDLPLKVESLKFLHQEILETKEILLQQQKQIYSQIGNSIQNNQISIQDIQQQNHLDEVIFNNRYIYEKVQINKIQIFF